MPAGEKTGSACSGAVMAVPVPCVWQDTLRPWAFPLLYVLFHVPAVQQLAPPHGLPEAQAAVTGGQFLL